MEIQISNLQTPEGYLEQLEKLPNPKVARRKCGKQAGEDIRSIREMLHFSIKQFAQNLGAAGTTVRKWESGENVPRQKYIKAIRRLIETTQNSNSEQVLASKIEISIRVPSLTSAIDLLKFLMETITSHPSKAIITKAELK